MRKSTSLSYTDFTSDELHLSRLQSSYLLTTNITHAGIICDKPGTDDWLFSLIPALLQQQVSISYILLIYNSIDHALVKKIMDIPGMDSVSIQFCNRTAIMGTEHIKGIDIPQGLLFYNISSCPAPRWLANETEYGILQFDFHINNYYSITIPLARGRELTTVNLLWTDKTSKTFTVQQMTFRTISHSLKKQIQFIRDAGVFTLARSMKECSHQHFRMKVPYTAESITEITPVEELLLFSRQIAASLVKLYDNFLSHNKWNIGVVKKPITAFLQPDAYYEVEWMDEMPGLNFTADPFCLTSNADVRIFFEQYDRKTDKGHIAAVSYRPGSFSKPVKVLENGHHLSYPYIFSENDRQYALVEMSSSNAIDLYSLEKDKWNHLKRLVENFSGVDPTIVKWENRWWLFCTEKKHKGADLRLYIYYADSIEDDWIPHAFNPVKTSIRGSRPAGAPFVHEGRLYRPSQDSSSGYGGRIIIQEVTDLSPLSFEEREATIIDPAQFSGDYFAGVHTINNSGNYTVIDGKRKKFMPANFFKFKRKNKNEAAVH